MSDLVDSGILRIRLKPEDADQLEQREERRRGDGDVANNQVGEQPLRELPVDL
jgi:hypothetical protein